MNAIDMLLEQHRLVEKLFRQFEEEESVTAKAKIAMEICDNLAVHAAIEETFFYPAVREKRTEDILLESLEEHLQMKRLIADLLDLDADDEEFEAKVTVLQEEVDHHVKEEEHDLFPKVKKILSFGELDGIANDMAALQAQLEDEGAPRERVRSETEEAHPL